MSQYPRPTLLPYETGTTAGGGLLAAPGSFFRRFRKATSGSTAQPVRPQPLRPDLQWLVTFERPYGEVASKAVLINGSHLQADIVTLARQALHDQHDIPAAIILRIQLDLGATPARVELLARLTRSLTTRQAFEQECG